MNSNKIKLDCYDGIIFDLDGTLIDSMWVWGEIDIAYFKRFGIPLPEKLQSQIEGMSMEETAIYIKRNFNIPDSIEKMQDDWNSMAYEFYKTKVELKKGASEFLELCKGAGKKLGIATSNSRELVDHIISVHALDKYFDVILTAGEAGRGKPAPDVYLHVAQRLQVMPEKCLVFEDVVNGIMAGKNAGMAVCAIEDEHSAAQREAKRLLADYYIEDYYDL